MCIYQSIEFKIWNDLSINSGDVGLISVELLFENRKSTIFNVLYKKPKGQTEPFDKLLKEKFSRIENLNKQVHVLGSWL